MSASNPTPEEKEKLQHFYLAARDLLAANMIPAAAVQRSFEEALNGFMGEETWRSSHISRDAIKEMHSGSHRNVQRAHGVLDGRVDRYVRTIDLLSGEVQEFDKWWEYYRMHDATILITKQEHASNKHFEEKDLVEIPVDERGLFTRGGFSFKFRKKFEHAWIKSVAGDQ